MRNPDIAQAKLNPSLHYLRHGGFEGRDPGPNFSNTLYLDTYEDVKASGINPLVHYLTTGRKEGRVIHHPIDDAALIRSSGLFDQTWYLAHNPDVANAKVDPVEHYLHHGSFEGRDPGPGFSSALYLDAYKDVKEGGINPLVHYLTRGRQAGYVIQNEDMVLIRSSGLFDQTWYLDNNPDVANAKVDPVFHYLYHGGFEGRDPSPKFSSALYLSYYEDAKQAGINPLVHYLRYGQEEGRITHTPKSEDLDLLQSTDLFDKDWYLANNPDVADAKIDPLLHYLEIGGFKGRDPGPDFSSQWYLDTHLDVKEAGLNPLIHYLRYGKEAWRTIVKSIQAMDAPPQYQCPICQHQFSIFIPVSPYFQYYAEKYGHPHGPDDYEHFIVDKDQCPNCHASHTDRLYALYLSRIIGDQPRDKTIKLLDIAPSQPLRDYLLGYPNIQYTSFDKYMEGVDVTGDITDMKEFPPDSFDVFICSMVLEHVNDDKKAISELFRIIKPNGFGILMVPIILSYSEIDEDPSITDPDERWRRFGQYDHVRLYSKKGFIQRVEDAGFIINRYGKDYFGEETFIKHGISFKTVLSIVVKP